MQEKNLVLLILHVFIGLCFSYEIPLVSRIYGIKFCQILLLIKIWPNQPVSQSQERVFFLPVCILEFSVTANTSLTRSCVHWQYTAKCNLEQIVESCWPVKFLQPIFQCYLNYAHYSNTVLIFDLKQNILKDETGSPT